MRSMLIRAGLAGALCMAAVPVLAEFRTLEGSVAYRERIALPPEALVEVALVDVSLADAPSVQLGAVTVRPSGQVPVGWQLSYDDAMVDARGRYAVQARITLEDKVLFRTTQVFPALTQDAPETIDVMVQMMPAAQAQPLEGTAWIGVEMPGTDLAPDRMPEITFGPENRVSGTGGCNRFSGGYERDGHDLTFGPLASTQMACPEPFAAQEQAVFAALDRVRHYEVDGMTLTLKDASGAVLMRLKTMY